MLEYNFGKIQNILATPELTKISRQSYFDFLDYKIKDILREISPIKDYNDTLHLYFDDCYFIMPQLTSKECIEKKFTYSSRLMVKCRLVNTLTGEIKESEVCFSEIPMMTEDNSFILNGITRVIVNQIVRSPGIYYTLNKKSVSYRMVEGLLMPHQGAWMELQNDSNDVIYIKMNRKKRLLITPFLRVLGLSEDEIKEVLTEKYYKKAIDKDKFQDYRESLIETYRKTKPNEPFSEESAKNIINYLYCSPERYTLKEVGRFKLNRKTNLDIPEDTLVLTKDDIVAYIKGYVETLDEKRGFDDIDHLSNRRVKTVGELIEEKFKSGVYSLVRPIKEQISVKGIDNATPSSIINPRPLQNTIKEFFLQDQLSQMLEATNPLSEITNKRRVSAIGRGGVNKDRAGMEVRDVHYSHYGRLCHIETPDGANIGLITSLAVYANIDKFGFITTPYRKIDKVNKKILNKVDYLNAEEEDNFYVAQIDIPSDNNGNILGNVIKARYRGEVVEVPVEKVDYMDVSPLQTISISASMIPFLHNDDATRAGMGCNMQRQAVPLMKPESPLVGTGSEDIMGAEYTRFADEDGEVVYVDSDRIDIKTKKDIKTYLLTNFMGTKKSTCIKETPVVHIGQKIKQGDPLYYKYSIDKDNGKLSLGKNVIVAYMPWEGYNYEDSILISSRLQEDDVYTSIHIENHIVDARETKLGPERFTSSPNELKDISTAQRQKLDENGFAKIGTKVQAGDILVGRVTPKGEKDLSPEERLVRVLYGSKSDMKNISQKVANGDWGTVINVKRFTKEDNMELGAGVLETAHIYLAKKRKIKVGDKMAGRHGNKGVVSRVLPKWEMPYLPDGTPVDIVLNPMGVPSRMNIGQILETHLGMAAKNLNIKYIIPAFDGPTTDDIKAELRKAGLPEDGKTILYDGRTGEPFDNRVTVGIAYMLRLSHIVDEKVHARSTGSYSLITQQPLSGKAQFGGQRFGEMEVWALEAHGAAYTLQEMLTIKSDDVIGREETITAILDGKEPPAPKLPESFKVLDRQLNALGLKLTINGMDNVTQSKEEDLREVRYMLDKSINETVKPWKQSKDKTQLESALEEIAPDEDEDDDDFDDDDDLADIDTTSILAKLKEKALDEDTITEDDIDNSDEYLDDDILSDI